MRVFSGEPGPQVGGGCYNRHTLLTLSGYINLDSGRYLSHSGDT